MTSTRTRLLGSGRTVVFFGGPDNHIPIAFCQMINETPPELVADYRPIQPIDWEHPAEIMTAMAMGEPPGSVLIKAKGVSTPEMHQG